MTARHDDSAGDPMIDPTTSTGLDQLKHALSVVACLVAAAAAEQAATAQVASNRQAEIDSILSSVVQAEKLIAAPQDGLHLTNLAPDVLDAHALYALLLPGHSLDVHLNILASAQIGGLFLSFGGPTLFPVTPGPFSIEVGGRAGVSTLTVTSGATLSQIGAALNALGPSAGFAAALSGTGIRLVSPDVGSHAFVSVRLIQTAHLPAYYSGIYRFESSDTNRADRASVVRFFSSESTSLQVDHGQNVVARVNGRPAFGWGATVVRLGWDLGAAIRLTTGPASGSANAQTLGAFRAFTIVRD
jgi:hypothetical protein